MHVYTVQYTCPIGFVYMDSVMSNKDSKTIFIYPSLDLKRLLPTLLKPSTTLFGFGACPAAGTFTLSSLPMCPQNENCEDAVEKLARELQHEVRQMLNFLVLH